MAKSFTTNYGLGMWQDHDNPGADELNNNWLLIDNLLSYMIDSRGIDVGKDEQTINGSLKLLNLLSVDTINENTTDAGVTIEGILHKDGRITGLLNPITNDEPATKEYVDQFAQGLDWQESVLDKDLTTPPTNPNVGDRYLILSGDTGTDWEGHNNEIAEWDGSVWQFTVPDKGTTVNVEDENKYYTYNGTDWILMANIFSHDQLANLQGGQSNEYYHLTQQEHNELIGGNVTILHTHKHSDLNNDEPEKHRLIDDSNPSLTTLYSGQKIEDRINDIKRFDYIVSNATELQQALDDIATQGIPGKSIYLRGGNYDKGSAFIIPPVERISIISDGTAIIWRPANDHAFKFSDTDVTEGFRIQGVVFDYDLPIPGDPDYVPSIHDNYDPNDDYAFFDGKSIGGIVRSYIQECIFRNNRNGRVFDIGFGDVYMRGNYFYNNYRVFRFTSAPRTAEKFLIIGNYFNWDAYMRNRVPRLMSIEGGRIGQMCKFSNNIMQSYNVIFDYVFYFNQTDAEWFRTIGITDNYFYVEGGNMNYLIYDERFGDSNAYRIGGYWANNQLANFDINKFTNVTSQRDYDDTLSGTQQQLHIHNNYQIA